MKWWDWVPWSSLFECWISSQLFHSPPSPSSRGCSVPLLLLPSAYLRLLIFLTAILVPACASTSLPFCMCSAYKLNKQGDNIQPWHTPFPIWIQSVVPCPVLTVASCPAYRFHRRQIRWSGIPLSWRIFQFNVIHTVKGFSVVNEAETDVFMEFSCFFNDPTDVQNLISGSSAFSKSSLYIWKFLVHVLLKPGLEDSEVCDQKSHSWRIQPNWKIQ